MRKKNTTSTLAAGVLLAGAAMAQSAFAQSVVTQAQPSGVLSLAAQASEDVPQDVVDITLFYEQEAKDPASLTTVLNQRAEAALRQAKGVENVTLPTCIESLILPASLDAAAKSLDSSTTSVRPRQAEMRPSRSVDG